MLSGSDLFLPLFDRCIYFWDAQCFKINLIFCNQELTHKNKKTNPTSSDIKHPLTAMFHFSHPFMHLHVTPSSDRIVSCAVFMQ